MTIKNKNTPTSVAAEGEGSESIAERSTPVAYLSRRGDNTGHTYGTWAGTDLPMADYMEVLLPVRDVQEIVAYGPRAIVINPECVTKQSAEARKRKAEKKAEARNKRLHNIIRELGDDHPELQALDVRMSEIEAEIERQALARMEAEDQGDGIDGAQ